MSWDYPTLFTSFSQRAVANTTEPEPRISGFLLSGLGYHWAHIITGWYASNFTWYWVLPLISHTNGKTEAQTAVATGLRMCCKAGFEPGTIAAASVSHYTPTVLLQSRKISPNLWPKTVNPRQWVSENYVFSSPDVPCSFKGSSWSSPCFAVTLSSQAVCVCGGGALI